MNGSDFRFSIRVGGVSIQFIPCTADGEYVNNVRDAIDYAAMLDEMMGAVNEDLRTANPSNGNVTLPPKRNTPPAAVAVPGAVANGQQWPAVAQGEIKLFDKNIEMEPYAVGTLDMATAMHYRSVGQHFVSQSSRLDTGHNGSVAVYFGTRQWPDMYVKPSDPPYSAAVGAMTDTRPILVTYKIGNPKKNGGGFYYDVIKMEPVY